ncbi:MAG: ATP-binding protein, partial [Acidimicrobiales bacterium]
MPAPRLVGRKSELDQLADAVHVEGEHDQCGMVLLAGDAGVGKSRLLHELRGRAESGGWRVLVGHCVELGENPPPYLPFSEVFAAVASESPATASALVASRHALRRLLPDVLGAPQPGAPTEAPRLDQSELFEEVGSGLAILANSAPTLLVIEDVHWADQSTRDMLSYLLTNSGSRRVAIVASYRSDDLHRRHPLRRALAEWSRLPEVERIRLPPLAEADVRELVAALHPDPIPAAQMDRIVARSEGNPFFVEELVGASEAGRDELPANLSDLLLLRIDRLDEPVRNVVRAASAAGRSVPHQLLAVVSSVDAGTLDAALRAAVESNVLVATGADGYAFRHALLSEAVYNDLLPGERLRIHAAYAAALGKDPGSGTPAELARHARGSNDLSTAIPASIQAAEQAMSLAAPGEALHQYEHALEMLATPGVPPDQAARVVEVTLAAANSAMAAGYPFRALALVQDQLSSPAVETSTEQRVLLLHALVSAALAVDTHLNVLEATTEALGLVPADPPTPMRARLLSLHARANTDRHRDEEAMRWATESLEIARRLGMADVIADASTTIAVLRKRSDEPEAAMSTLEDAARQARAVGEAGGELRARYNIASLHYQLGRLPEALSAFQATHERARTLGRSWAPYGFDSRAMAAVVSYVLGGWDRSLEIADPAGESAPGLPRAVLAATCMVVSAGRGDRDAVGLIPAIRSYWRHDGLVAVLSAAATIDLYGDSGDLASAIAIHDEVVSTVAELWQMPTFLARIRLSALLLGQVAAEASRAQSATRSDLASHAKELVDAASEASRWATETRYRGLESDAWLARVEAERLRVLWYCDPDPPGAQTMIGAWQVATDRFDRLGHLFEA